MKDQGGIGEGWFPPDSSICFCDAIFLLEIRSQQNPGPAGGCARGWPNCRLTESRIPVYSLPSPHALGTELWAGHSQPGVGRGGGEAG